MFPDVIDPLLLRTAATSTIAARVDLSDLPNAENQSVRRP
jgi:hypothetical protein